MEKLRQITEIGSNAAIIIAVLILGYFVLERGVSFSAKLKDANSESAIIPGTKLSLRNVDFGKSEKNLVLVLSTSCKYCTESLPFYRRLTEQNAAERKLNIVAAFSQEPPEASKYLIKNEISVDQVVKAEAAEIRVRGTPTLILTDRNGIVLDLWAGKLSPGMENEVADRVFNGLVVEMKK